MHTPCISVCWRIKWKKGKRRPFVFLIRACSHTIFTTSSSLNRWYKTGWIHAFMLLHQFWLYHLNVTEIMTHETRQHFPNLHTQISHLAPTTMPHSKSFKLPFFPILMLGLNFSRLSWPTPCLYRLLSRSVMPFMSGVDMMQVNKSKCNEWLAD